ncbi:MAG: linked oxidase domain protein [Gemmatimonadetes bacterium]|jgi:FAD/FMN-containing dehydrogenase|nr:linked oxidase domain protein [Gemmatimonadota bacterium]
MALPPTATPDHFRGDFRVDDAARAVYSEAAGIAQLLPLGVAVPRDADDVVTLVKWAARSGTPLVPRGSGSSMAGGAIGEGIVVDLSRLRELGAVNASRRTIRCGPGVLRDEVDAAARAVGLQFPVDPSSGAFCTVGGMASTNAAGAHTLLYGAMRPWVESLDVVFADGTRAELRRGELAPAVVPIQRFFAEADAILAAERATPSRHSGVRKESSGYGLAAWAASGDLVDLFVGSEGTLALIVGLELRLAPLLPATASVLGAFATLEQAVDGAAGARAAGAVACELLDRTFLDVARRGGGSVPAPESAEAVLLAEVEGTSAEECARQAEELERCFRAAGATDAVLALDPATEHGMWELRHAASPILSRLDPALKSMQFIEDGCVPPQRLADYVRGVRSALDAQRIRGVIFGHAGDAHVHVNPMVDVREPDWRERVLRLLDEVTALAARLGGTIAGEHGDGRLRAPLLGRVWPAETLALFAKVKRAFDPAGILNPGAKIASTSAQSVDRVKYDPTLAPLPAVSRAVLARVERERDYARFRLELLDEAERTLALSS